MPIYNMDCREYLSISRKEYHTIFADPPDNISYDYGTEFKDKNPNYINWIAHISRLCMQRCKVFWLSYNPRHFTLPWHVAGQRPMGWKVRQIVWTFGFGRYEQNDMARCYRPILRLSHPDWEPDWSKCKVQSVREKMGDKRASGKGKIPGDVLHFSRIQGNNKERRKWCATQHPEGLLDLILKCSGGGSVFDPFLGSATTGVVADRLGLEFDGCEIDKTTFLAMKNAFPEWKFQDQSS